MVTPPAPVEMVPPASRTPSDPVSAVPIAAVEAGVAPPPIVTAPPLLVMSVPAPRLMPPAPLASRSEFKITCNLLLVEVTSALLLKRISSLERMVSVASLPADLVIGPATETSLVAAVLVRLILPSASIPPVALTVIVPAVAVNAPAPMSVVAVSKVSESLAFPVTVRLALYCWSTPRIWMMSGFESLSVLISMPAPAPLGDLNVTLSPSVESILEKLSFVVPSSDSVIVSVPPVNVNTRVAATNSSVIGSKPV